MTTPKIKEVYRCPECDIEYGDDEDAANCCLEMPPKEFKCPHCSFVWSTADQAIRCFEIDEGKGRWREQNASN